jgi:hypothetical protein
LRPWLVLALIGALVLTNSTWRQRSILRKVFQRVEAVDRFVDIGVRLRVVKADPDGEELLEGARPMRVLREYRFGGIVDTQSTPPRLLTPEEGGESKQPQEWLCSEDQEKVILHPDTAPVGELAIGGMGAGKTTAGIVWTYLRWLENLGKGLEGGITAPTETRLDLVLNELFRMFPSSWYSYSAAAGIVTLCDRTRLRAVSTYQQSDAQGSRLAGFNWSWWLGDELQDQIGQFVQIQARLRAKKDGRAKRLGTATSKDNSEWRTLRDQLKASGLWETFSLLGPRSPFVHPEHWEAMKRVTDERDYRRLVLAEDLTPELAVYYGWERDRNRLHVPDIGATDVTASVLAPYQSYMRPGARFTLAAGHDPGSIYNTTVVARLKVIGGVATWVVVGELQTKQTTAQQHARLFREYVQDVFYLEKPDTSKVATFIDPHGKGEAQTDYQTVYGAFQANGLDAFNPAPMTQRIKRSARIEMVNRLMAGTAAAPGVPRLVVAQDSRGGPAAPRLVEAFEQLVKRPGDDDPEGIRKKDEADKTHAPAALGYLLWPFEQQAITEHTVKTALAEARRLRL